VSYKTCFFKNKWNKVKVYACVKVCLFLLFFTIIGGSKYAIVTANNDNIIICGFAEYGAFDDTAMGEVKKEVAVEEEVAAEDEPADDLGQAIHDAQRECKSEKEKIKFEHMLEDHKKLLYLTYEE
jgi:hypothetical protein